MASNIIERAIGISYKIHYKNDENVISPDLKTLKQYSEKWLVKFNAVECQQISITITLIQNTIWYMKQIPEW